MNGWTNAETWIVALWIYKDFCTDACWEEAKEDSCDVAHFRDKLEYTFKELAPDNIEGVYSDLLMRALRNVNWWEIAESFYEEKGEE